MKRPAAYIAEFVGTAVLVLAITGYISASSVQVEIFPLAIVHGLALMGIVYTIGSISGAHVNPAVTAALLAKMFFEARGAAVNYGTPGLSDAYLGGGKVGLGFLAEAIGTFILVW